MHGSQGQTPNSQPNLMVNSFVKEAEKILRSRITLTWLVTCCFIFLPLYIASSIMIWLYSHRVESVVKEFKDVDQNWKSDMIFELRPIPNLLVPEGMYITEWEGTFPGTRADCYCPKNANSESDKFKGRTCKGPDENTNCYLVPATPEVKLNRWLNGQTIYVVKAKETSFLESYKKINENGECKEGTHHCGDKDSKSKGICIDDTYQGCPITDIKSVYSQGYFSVYFNGFKMYVTNLPLGNPLAETNIAESHVCLKRDTFSITEGRNRYPPLKGSIKDCIQDSLAVAPLQRGERQLFAENNIDFSQFPDYDVSDNYMYKLFGIRFTEWSPLCKEEVDDVLISSQDMKELKKSSDLLWVFSLVVLIFLPISVFAMLYFILRWAQLKIHNSRGFCIFFIVFIVGTVFILPCVVSTYTQTNKLKLKLSNLASKQCGSEYTNAIISSNNQRFDTELVKFAKWWFWMSVLAFSLFIINSVYVLVNMMKKLVSESYLRKGLQDMGLGYQNIELPERGDTSYSQTLASEHIRGVNMRSASNPFDDATNKSVQQFRPS